MAAGRIWFRGFRSSATWMLALYLVWASGLAIAYFSLPGRPVLVWTLLGLSSVLAILVGIRRHRPDHRLPWYLLAAAVATFPAGDLIYTVLTLAPHQDNPFPSFVPAFHLAVYPLCAAALSRFIRARTPWDDDSSLLDALVITVGLGLLSWVYLIEPFVRAGEMTGMQRLISVTYLLGDVLLLALLARLVSAGDLRSRSLGLLTLATLGLLGADVLYGLIRLNGTWAVGGPVDGGWILFYVLLGATALHPSMVQMTTPLPHKPVDFGRARLLLLGAASLVAPVDAVVQVQLGHHEGSTVHSAASAALFVLVMTRLWGVVHTQQQGIARERTLRTAGAALVAAGDEGHVAEAVQAALSQLTSGQPDFCVGVVLSEGGEFRNIESGARTRLATRAPLATRTRLADRAPLAAPTPLAVLETEAVGALSGFGPALVDAEALAVLLSDPVQAGSTALVVPLRSVDSLIGALLVSGDARQLVLMQDAIQALGFKVALALQRIALADEVHRRASEAHFRSLIQNASDVILVVGADNQITYQTPSVTSVLGYRTSDLAGQPLERLLHDEDLEPSRALLDRMRRYGVDQDTKADWRLQCADGRWIDAEVVCRNLLDDPDVQGLVLTIRDVTERREMERELKHRAFHDNLTSLPNRGLFVERLQRALRRAASLNTLVGVLFIDVDEFKVVNDTRGHAVGDEVLQRVARILAASLRSGDSAARLGGDEFALLMEGAASMAEVEALAARVITELREPMAVDGQAKAFSVCVSIGIATSEHSTDASELLQLADLALYEAKASFKGSYRFFRDDLRANDVDWRNLA